MIVAVLIYIERLLTGGPNLQLFFTAACKGSASIHNEPNQN